MPLDLDEEREDDLPDFSGQADSSASAYDVLEAPPSDRRDLLEQHVRGVAEDLGIKLPEPRLAQASEVPPWERFGTPTTDSPKTPHDSNADRLPFCSRPHRELISSDRSELGEGVPCISMLIARTSRRHAGRYSRARSTSAS